jgi:hypothetical protein
MPSEPIVRPKRGYWYIEESWYCPQCGHDRTYRERIYDRPKPEEWEKRHIVHEAWDGCDAF